MDLPSFKEDHISQIPALELLQKLSYTYLTPDEALQQRRTPDQVILTDILTDQVSKINSFKYLDDTHSFDPSAITRAVELIRDVPMNEGPIRTNEKVYDLLTYGTSFEQFIKGDKKSFSFRFIDWENPQNNVYHVTEEFAVERTGSHDTYRPDIVLFVNGIPFVVIECKRPDLKKGKDAAIGEAISQHLRNQKEDGIPQLFKYSQILFAISTNNAKFSTAGTPDKFWSFWKEQTSFEEDLDRIKNTPLPPEQRAKLFSDRFRYVGRYFEELEKQKLEVTEQDRAIYNLLRPERLLELTYRYLVYDAGVKKIARYQQYFAIRNILDRIKHLNQGRRKGGVIFHTQGSGKSLTMVMLAKGIALDKAIVDPKIVLVTDRVDLDDQIYKTFRHCGLEDILVKAKSGDHLREVIKSKKASIITTIIDKFQSALSKKTFSDDSPNIFVLVDESHRSQYGEANIMMQKVFPNACYLGFTGTPLMKKDKSTAVKFGGIIDKYTIDQAVEDGAVVPLLYEGREALQHVNSDAIDRYFEKVAEPLTDYQKADLKKKFSKADQLNKAEQKMYEIAWNVSDHFADNWHGTGFKGQFTAPSKAAAIRYKKFFDDIGKVTTEVLISPPDTREGHEEIYEETDHLVNVFWKNTMSRYSSYEQYNKQLISQFKDTEEPEIIIVVDKLLTGFDCPRNTVLYLARSLRDHTLLQAIARVNRLHDGKDFGYIIDYYGILENLDSALHTYSSLADFDGDDLEGTLTSIRDEIKRLPDRQSHVWDLFKTIENRKDLEAYERLLHNEELREEFYELLTAFARTMKVAVSTTLFYETFSEDDIDRYKNDLKFFLNLRSSVRNRYSDVIDFSKYEKQIQKLIDRHVSTDEVVTITEPVNIFEKEKFAEELEKIQGDAKRADTIASRTSRHIDEKYAEDPAFYTKFSKMLQDVIDDFHAKRISDLDYLNKVNEIRDSILNHKDDSIPESLAGKDVAQAFFGIVLQEIDNTATPELVGISAQIALEIDKIIQRNKVVDWQYKTDVKNKIRQDIDDFLFDASSQYEMSLDIETIDQIIEKSIEVAKIRYR